MIEDNHLSGVILIEISGKMFQRKDLHLYVLNHYTISMKL